MHHVGRSVSEESVEGLPEERFGDDRRIDHHRLFVLLADFCVAQTFPAGVTRLRIGDVGNTSGDADPICCGTVDRDQLQGVGGGCDVLNGADQYGGADHRLAVLQRFSTLGRSHELLRRRPGQTMRLAA